MANSVDSSSSTYNAFNNMTVSTKYNDGITERGTKIVTNKSSVSQDTFLKILCAELQHQDPTQQQDAAQSISQLAQFAQLEQLQNVNSTISKNSYYSLLGKAVQVSDTDASGKYYSGLVQGLKINNDSTATITMIVNENGQNLEKTFNASHILQVVEPNDANTKPLNSLDLNMAFLMCSSFTGKQVRLEETDSNGNNTSYEGTVTSAEFENGVPKVNVKLDSTGEVKKFDYTAIVEVKDKNLNVPVETAQDETT